MKFAALALTGVCLAFALTDCTTTVTTTKATATAPATTATTTTNPLAQLSTFTQSDLANAITIATAAEKTNPSAVLIVNCFSYVQGQLATLAASSSSSTPSNVGLATAFTVADLALANGLNAVSATSQTAYATACGPLVIYVQNQGLTASAAIAALTAQLAK